MVRRDRVRQPNREWAIVRIGTALHSAVTRQPSTVPVVVSEEKTMIQRIGSGVLWACIVGAIVTVALA